MKKFLLILTQVLLICALFAFVACAPKTEYDDKEVVKIETAYYGGYATIDSQLTRTFDFEAGTVTDERVLNDFWMQSLLDDYIREPERFSEYENYEAYEEYLQSTYNNPVQIATFSQKNAEMLLKKVKSQGIYTWEDRYVYSGITDCMWSYIKIIFSDGTMKRTDFYLEYPSNMTKIRNAFKEYFTADIMWQDAWYDLDYYLPF